MHRTRPVAIAISVCFIFALALPAQQQDQNERRSRPIDAETRTLDNIFRLPRNVKLTDTQSAKIKALREKQGRDLAAKFLELQRKLNAVYTEQQLADRRKATSEARKAGKNAAQQREAGNAAVKLSDEQKSQIDKLRQEQQELLASVRREINAVLGRSSRRGNSAPRILPTHANVKYGPHERNVLDFWMAKTNQPAPVLVSIHGGGFRGGNKSVSGALLQQCLDSGISVAAITYRLSQHAIAPASFTDSARAIQFVRSRAKPWNIDPKRMAATGGSAGAGISLWLGFHDDMADLDSDDPVLRQSTRLSGMFVNNGQTSYDPRFIRDLFSGTDTYQHSALAQLFDVDLTKLDQLPESKLRLFEMVSPINHLSEDDPPAILSYNRSIDTKVTNQSIGIHHAQFGKVLKQRMDALGIRCEVYAVGKNLDGGPALSTIEFVQQILAVKKS